MSRDKIECENCGIEYERKSRYKKPGKITECNDCSNESAEKVRGLSVYNDELFEGVQIFSKKEDFEKALQFESSVASLFGASTPDRQSIGEESELNTNIESIEK